eukprot:m.493973 g.493973  ORF g.493973 m.493973 type:complete len:62 (+) comp21794_c0_seq39:601-786(+)
MMVFKLHINPCTAQTSLTTTHLYWLHWLDDSVSEQHLPSVASCRTTPDSCVVLCAPESGVL